MELDEKEHSEESVHEISFGVIIWNSERKIISESPVCTFMLVSFPPKCEELCIVTSNIETERFYRDTSF